MPLRYATEPQASAPSEKLKRFKGYVLVVVVISVTALLFFSTYTFIIYPRRLNESIDKNILIFNSLYQKSNFLGQSIINISKEPVSDNNQLMEKIETISIKKDEASILIEEYILESSKIDSGFDETTRTFAQLVRNAVSSQKEVLVHFEDYISYQVCLVSNGAVQGELYEELISTLNSIPPDISFGDQRSYYEKALNTLIDITSVNSQLDLCFEDPYIYLYSPEIQGKIEAQEVFYMSLQTEFTKILEFIDTNNTNGFFSSLKQLGDIIIDFENFFFLSSEFEIIRTKPIQDLISEFEKAEEDRQNLENYLTDIRKNYP